MSDLAMRAAAKVSGLDTAERAVLLMIAYRANEHGVCWPSMVTLGEDTGLSARWARVTVARLRKAGLVTVTRRHGQSSFLAVDPGTQRVFTRELSAHSLRDPGTQRAFTPELSAHYPGTQRATEQGLEQVKEQRTPPASPQAAVVAANGAGAGFRLGVICTRGCEHGFFHHDDGSVTICVCQRRW